MRRSSAASSPGSTTPARPPTTSSTARRALHPSCSRGTIRQAPDVAEHPRHAQEDDLSYSQHRRASVCRRIPDDITLSERVLWPCDGRGAGRHGGCAVRPIHRRRRLPLTTPPTRPTADLTSASNCSTPTDFLSFTSVPIVGAAAANKGLALFPRRITVASLRCRIGSRVEFGCLRGSSVRLGECACLSEPDPGLGGPATRQLRFADRDRAGMAGAHPRCRPDAHLQHRGDPA